MRDAADFGDEVFDPAPVLSADEATPGSRFALGIKFGVGPKSDHEVMHMPGVLRRLPSAMFEGIETADFRN